MVESVQRYCLLKVICNDSVTRFAKLASNNAPHSSKRGKLICFSGAKRDFAHNKFEAKVPNEVKHLK